LQLAIRFTSTRKEMPATRKRKAAVNYNENAQAKQFDIGDRKSKAPKSGKSGRPKRVPSAVKELDGKAGYRGNSANKSAPQATVLDEEADIPTRNKHGELVFKDHPEFRPNLSPKQVMQLGSFGGTYFRPITSGVTMEDYKSVHKEFPADWFKGIDLKTQVIAKKYNPAANKYGVKCGGGLDMWEGSGWIANIDPCKCDSLICYLRHYTTNINIVMHFRWLVPMVLPILSRPSLDRRREADCPRQRCCE
jgi:hypothetical protein